MELDFGKSKSTVAQSPVPIPDPGLETTISNMSTVQEITTAAATGHKCQICACGQWKNTSHWERTYHWKKDSWQMRDRGHALTISEKEIKSIEWCTATRCRPQKCVITTAMEEAGPNSHRDDWMFPLFHANLPQKHCQSVNLASPKDAVSGITTKSYTALSPNLENKWTATNPLPPAASNPRQTKYISWMDSVGNAHKQIINTMPS